VCYPPLTNESKRDIYLSPRCWWTSPARSSYHITVTQLSTTPAIRSGLGWRVAQHKLGRKYICVDVIVHLFSRRYVFSRSSHSLPDSVPSVDTVEYF
jgi:hypothetical protein